MHNRFASVAAAVLFALPTALHAQIEPTTNVDFAKGSTMLSAGLLSGGDYSGTGFGGQVQWGIGRVGRSTVSIGAFGGLQRNTTGVGTLEVSTTAIPLMATSNLHYALESQPRLDLFGGASVGLVRVTVKSNGTADEREAEINSAVGFQFGARYRVASRSSVFGQVGLGDLPLIFTGLSFVM